MEGVDGQARGYPSGYHGESVMSNPGSVFDVQRCLVSQSQLKFKLNAAYISRVIVSEWQLDIESIMKSCHVSGIRPVVP